MFRKALQFFQQQVLSNSSRRFLFVFISLYLLLSRFNWAFEGIVTPKNLYIPFVDHYLNYMRWLSSMLLAVSSWILELMGFQTFVFENWIRVAGRGGIVLAYPCLGFQIMSFFTAFVIAFPKPRKSRLRFLIGGLLAFQILNIIRFILLSLYWKGSSYVLDHHDLFNLVIYIILMISIFIWINTGERVR